LRERRFVADAMMGEVTRWLRIMGYDVLYSRNYSDAQVLSIAEKTGRTIITRDRGLYSRARRRGLRAVYIESDDIAGRLAELKLKANVKLRLDPSRSRCPECNTPLVEVAKEKVRGRVPPKVYEQQEVFYVCPRCARVYWVGSHWRNMRRILEEAERLASRAKRAGTPY